MVVGSGLLASVFEEYKENDNLVIFASGVSNSQETDPNKFDRESSLIQETIKSCGDKEIIYFSTYSILDPSLSNSPYIRHKKEMERIITSNSNSFIILRLSNIVGPGGNRTNIFNFLVESVRNELSFEIWKHATRNLLDVDHVKKLVDWVINSEIENNTLNITNLKSYSVLEIVNKIEQFFNIEANYNLIDKGASFKVDISLIEPVFNDLVGVDFEEDYLSYLLNKYY